MPCFRRIPISHSRPHFFAVERILARRVLRCSRVASRRSSETATLTLVISRATEEDGRAIVPKDVRYYYNPDPGLCADAKMAPAVVQTVQLKGHQKAVLCLDHSSSSSASGSTTGTSVGPSLLLSGSEDGTCRLWDLRTGRTASCIKCSSAAANGATGGSVSASPPSEVLSVAFGPSWENESDHGDDAASKPQSAFAREFSVYVSVENRVYGYDLRKATSPIVTEPSVDLSAFLEAPDEVNQIVFSPIRAGTTKLPPNKKGNRNKSNRIRSTNPATPILLATADDGGTVRVTADWMMTMRTGERRNDKRVFCHGTEAMVTSVAFAPRNSTSSNNKEQWLASGGTDCCIRIWDVLQQQQSSKKTPSSLVATIAISNSDAGANQVCNPPMVHSLDYSPSGRLLAAGLGDGSIAVVQGKVLTARLEDAHTGSVASCLFPAWSHHGSSVSSNCAISAHDRLLCSIGNDGCVVLWDLGATISGDKATNPADLLQLSAAATTTGTAESCMQENLQNMKLQDDGGMDQPQTLFAFQHSAGKPNWMVSGRSHDPVFPSSLFVADTTNDISIYTVPLQ